MRTFFRWFYGIIILLMIGCTDGHLGMRYQQIAIGKINNDSIYCYLFGWGTDAMAYYITKKKDPCLGLNAERDICLGKGEFIIYFNISRDTLYLYANTNAAIPKGFSEFAIMMNYDKQSYKQLEESYNKHRLRKVTFETAVLEVPCNLVYDTATKAMRRADGL